MSRGICPRRLRPVVEPMDSFAFRQKAASDSLSMQKQNVHCLVHLKRTKKTRFHAPPSTPESIKEVSVNCHVQQFGITFRPANQEA